MSVQPLDLNPVLAQTYGKRRLDREEIQGFKAGLDRLLQSCDPQQSEEFNKNLLSEFLKATFYGDRHFINTKEKSDLVIHNDRDSKSSVGVIFEVKKPTETVNVEMPRRDQLNTKAVQQLVLYFLRERVTFNNINIKHLIVTNVYEWFIFDAQLFEALFFGDKTLVKAFTDFEAGRLGGTKTQFFYQHVAEPAIAKGLGQIQFTYFDLRNVDDSELETIYKILSPQHLLKLPFVNDSNSLNKPFYYELLYIIGLEETKVKGKKIIEQVKNGDRQKGALIENTMDRLQGLGKIARLKNPEKFGETEDDRLFNVALQLSITWINRILFLKLLEAQLIKYHQGDQDFAFLNTTKIRNYSDLASLFFDVLAREPDRREADVKDLFAHVPYLNSSLFELTDIEDETITISNLKELNLTLFKGTVLKDDQGKRRSGELNALQYLFEFLSAYKFDRDELENPQEDSERLINASVLGLIFEKINGYKDGSFFTPGFITMYMCRETIRRAIVQKFNEVKGWQCETLEDLYEKIEDKKEANTIINSLKICDPAVGSGHFLVSALNEIIAIKSELRVLLDRSGKSLKDYRVEVKNDKLLVYDDEGNLFAYHPKNTEKQRVQEALFHEKQTIIENCLFGVDINPNSVTICRLRLWIELLKNAYYKSPQPPLASGASLGNLETLPNIDINIKCGNSLISRYELDSDLGQALRKGNHTIESYRQAVQTYRNAANKQEKWAMVKLIDDIKSSFRITLTGQDPNKTKLRNLEGELYQLQNQGSLFEESPKEKKAREKKITKLNNEIDKLRAEIEDIESGRLYDNALEWRFEFPEVLNDEGGFVGFDVVIGNPPYISNWDLSEKNRNLVLFLENNYKPYLNGHWDLFGCFIILGKNLLKENGLNTYILPTSFYKEKHSTLLRKSFLEEIKLIELLDFQELVVFEDVARQTGIYSIKKSQPINNNFLIKFNTTDKGFYVPQSFYLQLKNYAFKTNVTDKDISIYSKLHDNIALLGSLVCINTGVVAHSKKESKLKFTKDDVIHKNYEIGYKKYIVGSNLAQYSIKYNNDYMDYESKKEHFHRPKYPLLFESEKIIVRRISGSNNKLIACYDDEQYYSNDNLMHLVKWSDEILDFQKPENKWEINLNNKISIKYIIAILNSKLCTYYFSKFLSTDTLQGSYSSVYPEDIRQIPIKNIEKTQQKIIIKIVNQILSAKKEDPNADTSQLEKEIDHLVYKLYQLTYEEVKIIDPDFALTEQEYTAIKIE